jgi:hypothetical protein
MAELKLRAIHDQRHPARERPPVGTTRKGIRDPNSKLELDRRLDQALKETFPASDSMAIMIC